MRIVRFREHILKVTVCGLHNSNQTDGNFLTIWKALQVKDEAYDHG